VIYGWVGAGFRDCRLLTIMVGEPAPRSTMYMVIYGWVGAGFRDCRLLTIMVGEPAPTVSHKSPDTSN
ncbi:hypothetical protein, partial [Microcoleus sp. S13_D1]|uniref:hypothetical protein n=1 Tax=Microcoleus sp. S13_D1 TaxID=3055412 RepID=UPI002FD16F89